MIITRLLGGLGNQMFQYAAGLALAEQRRTVLKLDVSWFREYEEYEPHNRYALNCFNITEQFATREEIDRVCGRGFTRSEKILGGIARYLRLNRYAEFIAQEGHSYGCSEFFVRDPQFLQQPNPCYLDGMWQSESFFEPVADILRLHFGFRYPPLPAVADMEKRIKNTPASAFVHFRRGDYASNPDFRNTIGVLEMDYYYRSLDALHERTPGLELFVFSDDIKAIAHEFKPNLPCTFVDIVDHWHPWDKIRLMSTCQHGIIANSTFSWWGAWLIPNTEKIIIAPKQWRKSDKYNCADATPERWLRL